MFKTLIKATLTLGVASLIFAAEVSVFDAGRLDSDSPYGLTENEKLILEQKNSISDLTKDLNRLKTNYNNLNEQLEGVRSVLDGTASKVGQSDSKTKSIQNQVEEISSKVENSSEQLEILTNNLKEFQEAQESNNEKIRVVLTELSSLIDFINANYLPKSEADKILNKIESLEKGLGSVTSSKNESLKSKDGAVLIEEAKKLFDSGNFEDSRVRFEILLTKNYMPARSNYYLGEIAYNKKEWKSAIKYYKTSINLYDKAEYIPKLLYHTAISFDKINEPEQATPFYNALKTNYPDSKEAKAAPQR